MTIGEAMRGVRGEKSQQVFATELGISLRALTYYESGKRIPDLLTVMKVWDAAKACSIEEAFLADLVENTIPSGISARRV